MPHQKFNTHYNTHASSLYYYARRVNAIITQFSPICVDAREYATQLANQLAANSSTKMALQILIAGSVASAVVYIIIRLFS